MIRFNMKDFRENDYFTVGLMLSTIIMQGESHPGYSVQLLDSTSQVAWKNAIPPLKRFQI